MEKNTFDLKIFVKEHKKLSIIIGSLLAALILFFIVVSILYNARTKNNEDVTLYVYPETTYNQLADTLEAKNVVDKTSFSFKTYSKLLSLNKKIRPGKYLIHRKASVFATVKHIRNGEQEPVKLTINGARTIKDLTKNFTSNLMMKEDDFNSFLDSMGYEYPTELFYDIIPDTYEVYWTISPRDLMEKLKKTSDKWWDKRERDVKKSGFTKEELIILASIVNEETNADEEKDRIAGVYVNRLKMSMALQADPTVKFALQNFGLKRITGEHLKYDSKFNTYKYVGLPPAPICIPSVSSLKKTVKYEKHKYLYFCAKEDFSGRHNFAKDLKEHQKNARKYHKALNERNIK